MEAPALVLLALLALACTINAAPLYPAVECLDATFSSTNQFPSSFQAISSLQPIVTPVSTTVTIAKDFQIQYFATFKLVTDLYANKTYALYQCGTLAPLNSTLTPLVPAGSTLTSILSIPLHNLAVEDDSALAFMVMLGVSGRISYVTEYAVNQCMQSLGLYGCDRLTSGDANNYENINITTTGVDAIFGYQTSPVTVTFNAVQDPSPLGRAEWIKFTATFFNVEDVANAVFAGITATYSQVVANVTAVRANDTTRPVVAWIIYFPADIYGDVAQVQLSFATYKANYTMDAGGQMLDLATANATALAVGGVAGTDVLFQYSSLILRNFTLIPQQLRAILANCSVLIDETRYVYPKAIRNVDLTVQDVIDFYGFTAADVRTLPFLRDNMILREDAFSNPDGYTDWLEMGTARPDLALQDLASVVTPAAVPSPHTPRFFRLLGSQQSTLLSASSCPLFNCQLPSSPICPLVYRACDGSVQVANSTQRCAPSCAAA